MSDSSSRSGLKTYVWVLAAVAVLGLVVSGRSVAVNLDGRALLTVLAGTIAVVVVQGGFRLRRFRGSRSEINSYEEVLFPLLLVTVGPAQTVWALALGTLIVNIKENKSPFKMMFNVSQFTVAAAFASGVAVILGGVSVDARGVLAVGLASATFALLTIVLFGTLMGFIDESGWWTTLRFEAEQVGAVAVVEVTLGTTAAVAIVAVPALTPVALAAVLVSLHMHRRWFHVARDREQLDDVLRVTSDLHSSLTTDEVGEKLVSGVYALVSAEARLAANRIEAPAGGVALEIEGGQAGVKTLLVTRDTPLDPTAVSICETLARVAGVSYRMAALLEERERHAARLNEIIDERERFLAATAHQLRTPLTAMVGFSSLLWGDHEDPEMIREMMSHLVGQAAEMTHHLDNLLVSSRSLTSSVLIAPEPVDLYAEAQRAVSALAPGSGIDVQGEHTVVDADPVRVRHILRNFLVNAHQHGGPEVTVRVGSEEDLKWVEVIDDGPGLLAGAEELVFDAARPGVRESPTPEAAGLGLYVARLLARMMRGEVSYRREDTRSVFRLQFVS